MKFSMSPGVTFDPFPWQRAVIDEMIKFADQVPLSDFFAPQDKAFLFRPYLCPNCGFSPVGVTLHHYTFSCAEEGFFGVLEMKCAGCPCTVSYDLKDPHGMEFDHTEVCRCQCDNAIFYVGGYLLMEKDRLFHWCDLYIGQCTVCTENRLLFLTDCR